MFYTHKENSEDFLWESPSCNTSFPDSKIEICSFLIIWVLFLSTKYTLLKSWVIYLTNALGLYYAELRSISKEISKKQTENFKQRWMKSI